MKDRDDMGYSDGKMKVQQKEDVSDESCEIS